MHIAINVKSPNNISKCQTGFNSAFKGLSIKFYEKPSSENRVVPSGQKVGRRTDRHDETNSRFSQFYERVQKYKEI
jgi:hypothetical protein